MSDIIDLEEYPEDLEDGIYGRGIDNNDTSSTSSPLPDTPRPDQPRFITIKSYTEICIETGETVEAPPSSTRAKFTQEESRKNTTIHDKQEEVNSRRKKPPQRSQKGTTGEASTTRKGERRRKADSLGQASVSGDHKRAPCWLTAVACFCGVNDDYKWYSLKGKGLCLFLPMFVVYIVVSLAVLPLLTAAALGVAIFGCAGVASYLAMASNKVGVSLDEGDSSCFSKVYGSWV